MGEHFTPVIDRQSFHLAAAWIGELTVAVVTLLLCVLTSFCQNNADDVGNKYFLLFLRFTVSPKWSSI